MHNRFVYFTVILIALILSQSSCKQPQKAAEPDLIFKEVNSKTEIEADSKVIAIIGHTNITEKDKHRLNSLILLPLYKQFVEDNKIKPTKKEINAFVNRINVLKKQDMEMRQERRNKLISELKSTDLSKEEREKKETLLARTELTLKNLREMESQSKEIQEMNRKKIHQTADKVITRWKMNKALYEMYGGRVIFQQAGPEPLDAYRLFLKEQEKKGTFKIVDKSYEAGFWKYFTDKKMHTFFSKDEGDKAINTPWWKMNKP